MTPPTKAALTVASGITLLVGVIYYGFSTPRVTSYKGVVVTTHSTAAGWSSDFTWNGTAISMYANSAADALADATRAIDSYKGT